MGFILSGVNCNCIRMGCMGCVGWKGFKLTSVSPPHEDAGIYRDGVSGMRRKLKSQWSGRLM